jgi:carboxypeptidase Taq
VVRLKREEGACLAKPGQAPYDGLLDDYEFGMTSLRWDALFDDLEPRLRGLLPRILDRQEDARRRVAACPALKGPFDADLQLRACRHLAASIGYDFSRGRLDISSHPFSESIHAGDSRITTRTSADDLGNAFFSVLHETGHALYEQGLPPDWAGTPLGGPVSMAVHESQSRLWENQVGRSRGFWERERPAIAAILPAFGRIPLDTFLDSVNLVRPSLVRTESDEVTYNLHILIRYRLEKALIAGDLAVRDLPATWNEAYAGSLGVRPESDAFGVLQDVHWSAGYFGYFPTYTLGNLLSAQFMRAARREIDVSDLPSLLGWLRRKVHARGHFLDTRELVLEACGEEPSALPFADLLEAKYLA